jgi:hypothetical protein
MGLEVVTAGGAELGPVSFNMGFPIRLEVWVAPLVIRLEAERSWGPSRLERGFQSGLPVGLNPW